ncbi:MAG TPA: glycosyl hydrolase, partial [Psychromonas sp.]
MQNFKARNGIGICLASLCLAACSQGTSKGEQVQSSGAVNYGIETSQDVLVTSEAGDRIAARDNVVFEEGQAVGTVISVDPSVLRQTMVGVGTSFTESSAFVLAHLEKDERRAVME